MRNLEIILSFILQRNVVAIQNISWHRLNPEEEENGSGTVNESYHIKFIEEGEKGRNIFDIFCNEIRERLQTGFLAILGW